tara:strand:+ start:1907 stop:2092 length:186 start_codon:yes stop_codon:yes gene_type:complete
MSVYPEKEYVLCPECRGNGYFTPKKIIEGDDTVLIVCKYCEGTGHVGWKKTLEGSYGDLNE